MSEDEIRVEILEEIYTYHRREYYGASLASRLGGRHYTYRDLWCAHSLAAEFVKREHMGILKYRISTDRLRPIDECLYEEFKAKLKQYGLDEKEND